MSRRSNRLMLLDSEHATNTSTTNYVNVAYNLLPHNMSTQHNVTSRWVALNRPLDSVGPRFIVAALYTDRNLPESALVLRIVPSSLTFTTCTILQAYWKCIVGVLFMCLGYIGHIRHLYI